MLYRPCQEHKPGTGPLRWTDTWKVGGDTELHPPQLHLKELQVVAATERLSSETATRGR